LPNQKMNTLMNRKYIILLVFPIWALLFSCNPQKRMAKKKHAYMEAAYTSIKGAVNEAEVSILNDTIKVLFPEHLLFKKSSSSIQKETYPLMQRFANALNQYPQTNILINGYTDITGGDALNTTLSKQRADSAMTVLGEFSVKKDRMLTWGFGSSNPIADNQTEEGRRRNRRVEFVILYSYPSGS